MFIADDATYESIWNATSSLPGMQPSQEAPASYPVPVPVARTNPQRPVPAPRKVSIAQTPTEPKFKGEHFRFLKVLGKGSFGKVSTALK